MNGLTGSSTRRAFLGRAGWAGIAGALGFLREPAAAEPPPETTRIRLPLAPSICLAPQYIANDLLRSEGFTEVEWVSGGPTGLANAGTPGARRLGTGDVDVMTNFAAPLVVALDEGSPITILAGVHVGCFELIAAHNVRTITDLKGKTVAILSFGSAQHVFLSAMATQVGLDPRRDITWATYPADMAKQLLAEGKIDAFLGFPPDPQELRARRIGHVVVTSAIDRPWSQYFCCLIVANRDFASRYPIATKRAVRAILKGDQICALDPERAARAYLDRGFATRQEYALQAIKEIPYGRWREYDPADTLRFYALRLHEAGMIKSTPQKIISQGTDWRILKELKKELKG
jgi:NitT/TauT family transport system substrate-binding protein